ncbi:MAG: hypothetical protein U1F34_05535 [Gammaproteobacteria bacterium]
MKTIVNIASLLWRLARWNCYIWLPDYIKRSTSHRSARRVGKEITDVVVLVTDHFEPARKEGEVGVRRVREWCDRFAEVASKHRDSDGVMPQHTWFYRYDYPNYECIQILSEYVFRGLGEIEFHLHHGHDNADSFSEKIRSGVEWFNQVGAMLTAEATPKRRFAYIAGNWALDNGRRNDAMSGCNTELEVLGKAGCYADFTFPAFSVNAQPSTVNSIYYVTDTPSPKSYDRGIPMRVGGRASGDLLIFQGPISVDLCRGHIEYASLETFTPYFRERIDYWVKAGVSVVGRPEWLFVKLHTHGMQSRDTFLGAQMEQRCSDLEMLCKQTNCRLHYVTAREAFNIARAAEAGREGDAGQYRDFDIAKPVNRYLNCNVPYRVLSYSSEELVMAILQPSEKAEIYFDGLSVQAVCGGMVKAISIKHRNGAPTYLSVEGEGTCTITMRPANGDASEKRIVTLPFIEGRM